VERKQLVADLALLGVTAIWGLTFVTVKDAVTAFPVLAFLSLRFWMAFGLLALIAGLRAARRPQRAFDAATLRAGALVGLALFAGYAFQTFGLRLTTPAKAGFITGLSVVMVPLFSALLLRRPPERGALAGVALATAGLGLLSLQGNLSVAAGDLIVLACAVAFALHIIGLGAFSPRMDSLALLTVQIGVVAVLSLAASLLFERPWPAATPNVWGAALFTGLAATIVAFGVQTVAQRFTTPTHTALIFAMEPVWAGLFSLWLTGERLGPRALAGCGLILTGMLAAELLPALRTRAPAAPPAPKPADIAETAKID
jgi:drug/metabolite transporter (DMT)-like permease